MRPTPTELAWLRLALAEGIGPVVARRLLERFGDVERAARAAPRDLAAVGRQRRADTLALALRRARPAAVWRDAERLGQGVLTPESAAWPTDAFEALHDPPSALYVRGRLPPADAACAAIVGSRDAGAYGTRMARGIAERLAARQVWVVSGLALGIDASAHAGALSVPGGLTVAVLGTGVDVAYPAEHLDLKEEIASRGAVVSEYPPGTEPRPGHFPRRNRLVAALAEVTVVVEAGPRSGAKITAGIAVQLGRSVLAVPGPVSRAHASSHALLKSGQAALCEGANDVLALLHPYDPRQPVDDRPAPPPPPSGPPLAIWGVLAPDDVVSPDTLCRRTGLDVGSVIEGLALLEIEGYVARVPGLGFRRAL